MPRTKPRRRDPARRFGIGEWYGQSFLELHPTERQRLAEFNMLPAQSRKPAPPCPFVSRPCNKAGGVCTLRLYEQNSAGEVTLVGGDEGRLRTVCPRRFEQERLIYRWVGEQLLGSPDPIVVSEVGFLEKISSEEGISRDDVGRIDRILVTPDSSPLAWCALEKQAVYFSGDAMRSEWQAIKAHQGHGLPPPAGKRRPDYRSSGPKRLMPQLQIKVPSLRRWGKKMAVVVDVDFWGVLGAMDQVTNVSNCDIAWFIVRYDESSTAPKITLEDVRLTTLERSVEGLTAGLPVGLDIFEARIRRKLPRG